MPQLNVSNLVKGFRDVCFSGRRALFLEVTKLVSKGIKYKIHLN